MLKKINYLELLIIFGITILFCGNFLQMHYSSDTYVLYDLGYLNYPQKYFLLDGRIISTLICFLAGILHIPIPVYIIGMDFIGIIFMSISIYVLSNTIKKIIKPQNKLIEIAIIAGSFVTILNQFALEYLLFPESGVMCLGFFLSVLAVKYCIENMRYKYLKVFILLFISTICYQGLLNIFPIIAIFVYLIKQIYDDKTVGQKVKEFFIEMIKLASITIIVLLMCFAFIKIGKKALNSNQDRMMHLISFKAVLYRLETVKEYMIELWNESQHMLPTHMSTATLILGFVLLLCLHPKKWTFIQYSILVLLAFFVCVFPMMLFNTGICGRVNIPLQMLWGISLLILISQVNVQSKEYKMKIIVIYTILAFMVNSFFVMQNIAEHIAADRVDQQMGMQIKNMIEKYEQETGIEVNKFSYIYDANPSQFAKGIKMIGSLTERKLACSWCIKEAMDFYCNKKFKVTEYRFDTIKSLFGEEYRKKNYDYFSEDQVSFLGDTIYLIVY